MWAQQVVSTISIVCFKVEGFIKVLDLTVVCVEEPVDHTLLYRIAALQGQGPQSLVNTLEYPHAVILTAIRA